MRRFAAAWAAWPRSSVCAVSMQTLTPLFAAAIRTKQRSLSFSPTDFAAPYQSHSHGASWPMRCNAPSKRARQIRSTRFAKGRRRSTLPCLFQLRDQSARAIRKIAGIFPNLSSIAVEHDDGGKPRHLIVRGQSLVLPLHLRRLLLGARKIDCQKDQILARVLLELRLGENVLIQLDAPAAPIGPGEVEQQKLVVGLRFLLGLFVISQPGLFRAYGRRNEQSKNEGNSG